MVGVDWNLMERGPEPQRPTKHHEGAHLSGVTKPASYPIAELDVHSPHRGRMTQVMVVMYSELLPARAGCGGHQG
jgi:hypothetical protein